jgi:hypothetical protein
MPGLAKIRQSYNLCRDGMARCRQRSPDGSHVVYSRYGDQYSAEPVKLWSRNPMLSKRIVLFVAI